MPSFLTPLPRDLPFFTFNNPFPQCIANLSSVFVIIGASYLTLLSRHLPLLPFLECGATLTPIYLILGVAFPHITSPVNFPPLGSLKLPLTSPYLASPTSLPRSSDLLRPVLILPPDLPALLLLQCLASPRGT